MYSDTAIRTSLASLPSLLHHDAGALADQRARQSFKTTTLITQTAQLADGEASHITKKKRTDISGVPNTTPTSPDQGDHRIEATFQKALPFAAPPRLSVIRSLSE